MRTLRINVNGIVQGVGFRHFTRRTADRYGVKGWVRNLQDGGVEVLAQFPDEKTENIFLNALRQGPLHSEVTGIDFTIEEHHGPFNAFNVTF
jgi:acylphosphatase